MKPPLWRPFFSIVIVSLISDARIMKECLHLELPILWSRTTSRLPPHFPYPSQHTSWYNSCHTARTSCLCLKQSVRKSARSRIMTPVFLSGELQLLARRRRRRKKRRGDGLFLSSLAERRSLRVHEVITRFIWQGNNYWTSSAAATVSRRPFNCRAPVFVNMYFYGQAQE